MDPLFTGCSAPLGLQIRCQLQADESAAVSALQGTLAQHNQCRPVVCSFAGGKTGYTGPTTPCTAAKGYMPRNQPGMGEEWCLERAIADCGIWMHMMQTSASSWC